MDCVIEELLEKYRKRLCVLQSVIDRENEKRLKKYKIKLTDDKKSLFVIYLDKLVEKINTKVKASEANTLNLAAIKRHFLDEFTVTCAFVVDKPGIIGHGEAYLKALDSIL